MITTESLLEKVAAMKSMKSLASLGGEAAVRKKLSPVGKIDLSPGKIKSTVGKTLHETDIKARPRLRTMKAPHTPMRKPGDISAPSLADKSGLGLTHGPKLKSTAYAKGPGSKRLHKG